MVELFQSMSIGLGVWFFTYGINRIWLFFKGMIS